MHTYTHSTNDSSSPLVRLGERILERVAPRTTAQAMAGRCHFQYRCVVNRHTICAGFREARQRRQVCVDNGDIHYGPWETVGCC